MANPFNRKFTHNPNAPHELTNPTVPDSTATHGIQLPLEQDKELYESLYRKYVHAREELQAEDVVQTERSLDNLKFGIALALHKKGKLTTSAIQRTLRISYDKAFKLKEGVLAYLSATE